MTYGWAHPGPQGSYYWVHQYGGNVPPGAVLAGTDLDGGPIYIGRASYAGDVLPAKACPSHGCAYVSHAGAEISVKDYEILVGQNVAWRPASGGDIPSQAIKAGQTSAGEPLFVGRTMHEGTLTPGKVHPSHGCLYIPYGGEELRFDDYEILILM
ncbi:unnamed protein product [Nesidiocoris tenuis]|uniref:Natterin-3 n=1 Tax=Nesidiocoris tenuis TaxID=355587 RepID=A0A6H5GZY1_9HEMI|nr:unnamed protein product [Nesidiocoris tenuis]CAB0018795.1 unnamed protein product [Nesidiocoris tenuis]